jgi:hypothetical protein
MAGFLEILRSGAWLTRARARLVAVALLIAFALGALFLIATSDGRNDRFGRPLGTDFSNVYAAGTYVLPANRARRSIRSANTPARSPSSARRRRSSSAFGTVLATPYSLDYDLMILAPTIAFLAIDGMRRGFGPYEKSLLVTLGMVPLITRSVPDATLIPLAVPLILLAFVWLLRCAIHESDALHAGGILRRVP